MALNIINKKYFKNLYAIFLLKIGYFLFIYFKKL